MPCGSCGGGRANASVEYLAKANDGTQKIVATVTEAKLYLAQHGGGSHRAVAKKPA